MRDDLGGQGRRTGTAALVAALTLGAAAPSASAAAPVPATAPVQVLRPQSLPAATGAALRAALPPKSRAVVGSRLATLSSPAVRTAPRAEQARRVGLPASGPGSLLRSGSDLVVDVRTVTTSPGQVEALRRAGGRVLHVAADLRTVTVAVAPDELTALAAVPGVGAVTPELTPMTAGLGGGGVGAAANCGSVTSEADQQLHASDARDAFGVDGTGVKVGVISDSYDVDVGDTKSAAQDVTSGDLPGVGNPCGRLTPVQLVAEGSGNDEGRAMLEVVHDLAPGAALAFGTALPESAFPDRVAALRTAGANVVVDDVSYFDEPFFQDGPPAVAANTAFANGTAYYSSAANNNLIVNGVDRASYEAPSYRPIDCSLQPDYLSCMNFGTAANPADLQRFTVAPQSSLVVDLQWAEPWFGVNTDIDGFLLNETLTAFVAVSDQNNSVTQKPFEIFGVDNLDTVPHDFFLVIGKFAGAANPRLKYNLTQPQGQITGVPPLTPGDIAGPTIFGHNGAPGAMSIAAVPFNNSAVVEPFSSRGPVTHYFGPVNGTTPAAPTAPQALAKPDLAATDGGQTTFFGGTSAPFRFLGTSEAAPHAAAVAALQMHAQPCASVATVEAAQKSTASPVGAFGAVAQGAGLVNALDSVDALPDTFVPKATTGAASGVTLSTATVGGVVNPCRLATSYRFEYGPTPAYGSFTPSTAVGSGGADVAASAAIAGLVASTTYHFRLTAANVLGATTGADGTFTTAAAPVVAPPGGGGGGTPPNPKPPTPPTPPKAKLKLSGRTLTLTFSGGTFSRASVTIKKGKSTVAKKSGPVRNNKFKIKLKKRLKKGRYSLTIVLTDTQKKKTTLRTSLRV